MANRPQIDPERKESASIQVVVRLLPSQANRLRRLAERQQTTMSKLLRGLLDALGKEDTKEEISNG